MATIRAYKLAEELKIGNDELLKKCEEIGISLRNHMANLSPEQADQIRRRFGGAPAGETQEKRTAGGTVIRRRRIATPEPLPKDEGTLDAPEVPEIAEVEPVAAEVAPVEPPPPVEEPVVEPVVVEPVAPEPVVP